ncbi:MarR family winged helix-turn-helix transcriptional regulator [Saccharothrix sp. Mg75]|uniref:MarR family winged helix-turn-helix transcriptional regulator n=1 Tax=Saccharothrix sp. Mg75 TaxID=3445357 RepID=UPI003EE99282
MKDVHKSTLAVDDEDFLYDSGVRASMTTFTGGDDTLALEAAAAIRSAAQAVDKLRSRGAGGRGLSAGALDVLARLSTAPDDGLSVGELAQAAGVTSRNVTGLVDTLERDALVRRVPDPDDRRSVRVQATDAGREWLTAFREPTARAMAAVFAGFTDEDLARTRHLCLRLVENAQRVERHLEGR